MWYTCYIKMIDIVARISIRTSMSTRKTNWKLWGIISTVMTLRRCNFGSSSWVAPLLTGSPEVFSVGETNFLVLSLNKKLFFISLLRKRL